MKLALIAISIVIAILGAMAIGIAVLYTYTRQPQSECIDVRMEGSSKYVYISYTFAIVSRGTLVIKPIALPPNSSVVQRFWQTAVLLNGKPLALIKWYSLEPVRISIPSYGLLAVRTLVPICIEFIPSARSARIDLMLYGLAMLSLSFILSMISCGFGANTIRKLLRTRVLQGE